MSGEITLREYVDAKFASSDNAIAAALSAAKEAVDKAEKATEKRFENVNEFRATLADQQRTLIPRAEAELLMKGFNERVKALELAKVEVSGEKGGMKNLWAIMVGVLGVISLIVGLFLALTK